MKGTLRAFAALLCLALAGCFFSEEELIGFWRADRGLEPGLYTHTPFDPEGEEWDRPTWRGHIDYDGRRYTSQTPDFPHEQVRLRRLDGDIYIAQLPRQDGIGYGIAFAYPGMLTYHQPDCWALSEAARAEAGVTLGEEGFCRIADLDQLEAVMRTYLDALDGDVRLDGIYRRMD